jgi:hypothetical protein
MATAAVMDIGVATDTVGVMQAVIVEDTDTAVVVSMVVATVVADAAN